VASKYGELEVPPVDVFIARGTFYKLKSSDPRQYWTCATKYLAEKQAGRSPGREFLDCKIEPLMPI
jgi:hypothetical protein